VSELSRGILEGEIKQGILGAAQCRLQSDGYGSLWPGYSYSAGSTRIMSSES